MTTITKHRTWANAAISSLTAALKDTPLGATLSTLEESYHAELNESKMHEDTATEYRMRNTELREERNQLNTRIFELEEVLSLRASEPIPGRSKSELRAELEAADVDVDRMLSGVRAIVSNAPVKVIDGDDGSERDEPDLAQRVADRVGIASAGGESSVTVGGHTISLVADESMPEGVSMLIAPADTCPVCLNDDPGGPCIREDCPNLVDAADYLDDYSETECTVDGCDLFNRFHSGPCEFADAPYDPRKADVADFCAKYADKPALSDICPTCNVSVTVLQDRLSKANTTITRMQAKNARADRELFLDYPDLFVDYPDLLTRVAKLERDHVTMAGEVWDRVKWLERRAGGGEPEDAEECNCPQARALHRDLDAKTEECARLHARVAELTSFTLVEWPEGMERPRTREDIVKGEHAAEIASHERSYHKLCDEVRRLCGAINPDPKPEPRNLEQWMIRCGEMARSEKP